jgi:hypothetical protein
MHERGDLVAVLLIGDRKISARVESGIVNKSSTWPEDSTTRWCGGIPMRTGLFRQDDSMILNNTALVVGGHAVRPPLPSWG